MEHLVRAEHGDPIEDDAEDEDALPGLYHPFAYVFQTWMNFKEHGILPAAGGWDDQDWRLVEADWVVLNARYNRMNKLLYPTGDKEGNGNGIQLPQPGTAGDWRDILK